MKRILLAVLGSAFIALAHSAHATPIQALVVESCGSESFRIGGYGPLTIDTSGRICGVGGGGGGGGVSSVTAGTGLTATPNPITDTGTISLATIPNLRVLSNISGGTAVPVANSMTTILDTIFGSTQGSILTRGASDWSLLAPGTVRLPIISGGSGANIAYGPIDLTSAVANALPVANGGTGASAAGATAANNIGALAQASNLSDLGSATTARTNLGLGSAATKAASGAGATVASTSGSFTTGDCLRAADTAGTIEDAGATCGSGGGGSPGGTSGQVQFNDAGAFGGFTLGGDATLDTGTGALTVGSYNGGTAFGTAAALNSGTSGTTLCLLSATCTWSNPQTFSQGFNSNGSSNFSAGLEVSSGDVTLSALDASSIVCTDASKVLTTSGCPSSGAPGGSSGQIQFNNDGAFGGLTVSGDGTLDTSTGELTVTKSNGSTFGTAAFVNTGTNGAVVCLASGGCSRSGFTILTGQVTLTPSGANGVNIAPTGTGTVTINPTTAGTINNMAGAFTTISDAALDASAGVVCTDASKNLTTTGCSGGGGGVSLTSPNGTLALSPSPITGTGTLDIDLTHANTWSGVQTFASGDLSLAGATSGSTLLEASAAASGTLTLPAATDTLVGRATTDTLTNKTISGGTFSGNIAGNPTFTGSIAFDGSINAVVSSVNINASSSGSMNGVTIGGTTPEPGTFTSVSLPAGGPAPSTYGMYATGGGSAGLNLASGGGTSRLLITVNGHEIYMNSGSLTASNLSGCGTSPTITGNDSGGNITLGTGTITACILTFAVAYAAAPVCVATDDSTAIPAAITALSATAVTFSFATALTSGHIYYHCAQYS